MAQYQRRTRAPPGSGPRDAPVPKLTRAWVTWTPLLITIVAGLASMIIPARMQREATQVRRQIVRQVEPARRATERAEAAFTAEVGTTRLYALEGDSVLLREWTLARLETDSAFDTLSRRAARVGGRTMQHVDAMRQAVVRWRFVRDSLVRDQTSLGAFARGLGTQKAYLDDVLVHADSLSEELKLEADTRREHIRRLNRSSMIANVGLAMLSVTAVLAVAWLTRRQLALSRSLHNRTEEEIALREVARSLSAARSVAELATQIVQGAVRATHAFGAYVERRTDGADGTMEVLARDGHGAPPVGTRVPYPGSLTAQIIDQAEPALLPRVRAIGEPMAPHLAKHCAECSGIVVPLMTEDHVLGALVVLRSRIQPGFTADDIWRARMLGDICTAALRRAMLTDAIETERTGKALMLDSAGDGIYSVDSAGRFTFLNRAGAEMLGYSPEEVIGRDAHALIHHSRADGTPYPPDECPIYHAEQSGERVYVTSEVLWRKDGTSFPVEYSSSPIRHGQHRGMVTTFRDVTARRAAEEERERLLEAERQAHDEADRRARQEVALRRTAEALAGAYTRGDVSNQVCEWALVATDVRGAFVTEVNVPADSVRVTAVAGDGVPAVGDALPRGGTYTEAALEAGEPTIVRDVAKAEYPLFPSLAARCSTCALLVVPLRVGNDPIGALWLISRGPDGFDDEQVGQARIFADLGALAYQKVKLLEAIERRRAQLEQVMGSRSRLMRGFSHDVKNPLGAADGHAALLLEGIYGQLDGRQRDSVLRIRHSIRHALALIDDLHELARVETGIIDVRRQPVDVGELLVGLVEEYRAAADTARLMLSVEICTPRTTVLTDGRRVRQVLSNLLSNAIKYTDSGSIKLRLGRTGAGPDGERGDWVDIAVVDTGPGIPRDKLGLLFREFSRIGPNEKPGAGLGLAISQRLAEALGGRVTVHSAVGTGSTFTLWLPAEARHSTRRLGTSNER